jgi:hypothetical protein
MQILRARFLDQNVPSRHSHLLRGGYISKARLATQKPRLNLAAAVAAAAEESRPCPGPGTVASRRDPLIDPLTGALAAQLAAPSITSSSDLSHYNPNSTFSHGSSAAAPSSMEDFVADDMAAQEAAARDYQPELTVCPACTCHSNGMDHTFCIRCIGCANVPPYCRDHWLGRRRRVMPSPRNMQRPIQDLW